MMQVTTISSECYSKSLERSVSVLCVCRALSEYAVEAPLADLTQVALSPLLHQEDDGQSHTLTLSLQVRLTLSPLLHQQEDDGQSHALTLNLQVRLDLELFV